MATLRRDSFDDLSIDFIIEDMGEEEVYAQLKFQYFNIYYEYTTSEYEALISTFKEFYNSHLDSFEINLDNQPDMLETCNIVISKFTDEEINIHINLTKAIMSDCGIFNDEVRVTCDFNTKFDSFVDFYKSLLSEYQRMSK